MCYSPTFRLLPSIWTRRFGLSRFRKYHSQSSLLDDLSQRGFVQDVTRQDVLEIVLRNSSQTVYAGVDPTAKSLHIGHLIPLICLLRFQVHGHRIIPLVGGATGRVGDPSGRPTERQPADIKQVEDNVVSLTSGIQKFFRHALRYVHSRTGSQKIIYSEPSIISNLEWHESFTLLDFLQKVGVHVRINTMMNRDSVRTRLESQQGLSFTEFTYQLMQAYDFYHLHKYHNCTIQIGGSDQWGNIVAGLELISRLKPLESPTRDAFGITTPLLTTSRGEKFGKSSGNAVWLDSELTSVFDFYQYFLKVADADVEKYLKLFTFLQLEEIKSIVEAHIINPEKRIAQNRLASEITEMVHEKSGVLRATTMTKLAFGSNYSKLKSDDVISSFENDPRLVFVTKEELFQVPMIKLAARYGLVSSNSVARNLVLSKGLYLNQESIQDPHHKITEANLLDNRIVVFRAGKDKLLLLAISIPV